MDLRAGWQRGLAGQLGRPHGLGGRLVARRLNRNNAPMVEAAVEAAAAGPGQRVADLGFGGGSGVALLLRRVRPGGYVSGVDLSETMVTRARRTFAAEIAAGELTLATGDLTALPLADAALDIALTLNTVYFVKDLAALFAELARVLQPAGRAVIGISDPDAMARMPVTAYGFLLRPVQELVDRLERAGLRLVEHRRLGDGDRVFHLLVLART